MNIATAIRRLLALLQLRYRHWSGNTFEIRFSAVEFYESGEIKRIEL